MELVDIVDDNLKTLYSISKSEAHLKGLLHKTVISEVIDSQGKILLVKQAGHKQDAGQFVSPVGGHVSAGESNDDALLRETKEEIGIKNFKFKLLGSFIFNRQVIGRHENHFFIIYKITSDSNPILNDESSDFKWFSKKEIIQGMSKDKKMFGDALYPIWEKFNSDF